METRKEENYSDYEILILQTAVESLEEILIIKARKSTAEANAWYACLLQQMKELAQTPHTGLAFPLKTTVSDYRLLLFEEWFLLYEVLRPEKKVIVLRILDAKQDYPLLYENYISAYYV